MSHLGDSTADYLILAVAGVSLLLTGLALGAWRQSRNHKLLFVAGAFALFFAKEVLTAYSIHTGYVAHEDLELAGAGFDLLIVVLLVAPFLRRT